MRVDTFNEQVSKYSKVVITRGSISIEKETPVQSESRYPYYASEYHYILSNGFSNHYDELILNEAEKIRIKEDFCVLCYLSEDVSQLDFYIEDEIALTVYFETYNELHTPKIFEVMSLNSSITTNVSIHIDRQSSHLDELIHISGQQVQGDYLSSSSVNELIEADVIESQGMFVACNDGRAFILGYPSYSTDVSTKDFPASGAILIGQTNINLPKE